ncbi:exonuclease domain-containing protein [Brevibacillus fulvus]|uniref:DNA polymerase-3 subunit epsilon n=1 Tax=Brevibacillus fulvus TaxID=1125967 RepID=A0A939BUN1_9BACL|nr:exonuclease domain-containing protein [Brevibacillus fulvus]MBM7589756.1 DNA polymerase-3 subunit epsilon [Brevibacillus fulvus]
MRSGWNPFQRFRTSQREDGLPDSLSTAGSNSNPGYLAFLRSLVKERQSTSTHELSLEELEVVVVDLETTGFQPYRGDEIISIGAVAMRGSHVLEEERFYSLVQPNRPVPEHIALLTGITDDDLNTAPDLPQTLGRFFQFVGQRPLVAHHSRHEREFFRAAFRKVRQAQFDHRLLDTMLLIQLSSRPLGNATLDTLCAINSIEILKRHDAFYDALATAKLWGIYLEKAWQLGYRTLADVYANHR